MHGCYFGVEDIWRPKRQGGESNYFHTMHVINTPRLTLEQNRDVLAKLDSSPVKYNGIHQALADEFGVHASTITYIKKNREPIELDATSDFSSVSQRKKPLAEQQQFDLVASMLANWYQSLQNDIPISYRVLQIKALEYHKLLNDHGCNPLKPQWDGFKNFADATTSRAYELMEKQARWIQMICFEAETTGRNF